MIVLWAGVVAWVGLEGGLSALVGEWVCCEGNSLWVICGRGGGDGVPVFRDRSIVAGAGAS